jgi:hypothetical protein
VELLDFGFAETAAALDLLGDLTFIDMLSYRNPSDLKGTTSLCDWKRG